MISISHPQAAEILELALSLGQATDIERLLTELAEKITSLFHAEKVRLFVYNAKTNELHTKFKFHDVYTGLRFPVSNDTLAGYTAQNKQVVSVSDVRDPLEIANYPGMTYDPRYEEKTGVEVRSILSVPLLLKEKELIGIIQLINTKDGSFRSPKVANFLSHLGKIVSAALFHHGTPQRLAGKFDLLLEKGSISQDELKEATHTAREQADEPLKGDVVSVLLESFHVPEEAMAAALSRYYLTDFLPYSETRLIPPELLKGFNPTYFRNNFAIPIAMAGDTLSILIDDPLNYDVINEIKTTMMAEEVKLYVGFRRDILKYLGGVERMAEPHRDVSSLLAISAEPPAEEDKDDEFENILNENAPLVIQVVNKMILDAFEKSASDIHIEPGVGKEKTMIRFRSDGACFPYTNIAPTLSQSVLNRIKLLAGLKLDEHRLPQSGKIRLKSGHDIIELRVEITPTVGGKEDAVLRLLSGRGFLSLDDLDFSDANRAELLSIIRRPYGIFLAVGPTGSGKTTTLHALIHLLNAPEKKIWTVEDPVEITQKGLRQVQVNRSIKGDPLDFARAMRSLLRADPDIIMIGEMRDLETAKIAVEASLTGHLVLSTLHTNSAAETVTRLTEMGIGAMNVADSLLGVLAQRLVRLLCDHCKEAYTASPTEIATLIEEYGKTHASEIGLTDEEAPTLYKPAGCHHCNNSGYRGRAGIHELLVASPAIKHLIHTQSTAEAIKERALAEGTRTLKMDGIRKVLAGKTTLSEVKSVCIE
ncbi:general secretory pathway protein GspE [Desulfoluna limicola]|uniref:General secretory pathway protein GspE n=1 Tax=Desulfoluna limicola TaxID=2810562 RepID=A0ABM7PKG9_9BACT|nr:GspE/PulE family protein [Desulfoluna limicola]BCS97915.1 general secretory pathway protein GspE [Desulfoluna limicola]